ncbi:MAG: hypothetical protein ACRD0D_05250, partial [Acidimicrobiales bacterium]
VTAVLTSAHARCAATVAPLAEALGLAVERRAELAEGAGQAAALELVRRVASDVTVLCTHGDIVMDLLDGLERDDGIALAPAYPLAKGSTWVLEFDGGRCASARYLPPPAG